MTDEEQKVMDRACAIVRDAMREGLIPGRPQKIDVVAVHCHPDDETDIRAAFDAPIVLDPTTKRGTIVVVPHARAENITMTIGFADPVAVTRRMRIAAAITREKLADVLSWWWVSFSKDGKFAGVAIVEVLGHAHAILKTHELGINPGGEVLPVEIPAEEAAKIPSEATNRLLDLETLRSFFPDLVKRDGSAV